MSYTISQIKDDLTGVIHGGSLNKVKNINSLFNRAARTLLAQLDPAETIRSTQITNALHDDIFDYSAPSDLKGNKIVDIRPQVNRTIKDNFTQKYSEGFDLRKEFLAGRDTFQVKHESGTKTLRVSKLTNHAPTNLHDMDGITTNGTWAVGGDASNLTADTTTYIQGNGSLNFDLDASGSAAWIENSTMSSVDLETHDEVSSLFARVYLPDSSIITSVALRWGSSSSNYWTATATSPHDVSSFKNGWNIIQFDWNGATETGTVDPTAINYLRVTINYDGTADTDIRVDRITSSIGTIFEIEYYSKFLFSNSAGTFQETTSLDTDTVNLDTDSYNLYLFQIADYASQQMQGEDSGFDVNYFDKILFGDRTPKNPGLYAKYREDNPSEAIKPRHNYYRIRHNSNFRSGVRLV